MQFADLNLNKPLLNALEQLGYTEPTTIQQRVFSVAMSGRDICGVAQTGTGKTFAYLLPCLRQWQFAKDRSPQVLILVPTRELVTQVVEAIESLTTEMNLVAVGVYGGVNIRTQQEALMKGVDVLVATPGRFYDLALNGAFKTKTIRKLVIDEVDEMLNLGFRAQLTNLFDYLPARRQNLLFSATMTPDVEALIAAYFNNPVRIEAAPAGTPLEKIRQYRYAVPNFHTKVNLLEWLLRNDPAFRKVLVFTSTKHLADLLWNELEQRFPGEGGVIHSNKEQNYRFRTVANFKEGIYRFIIATDIVARGIDIAEVTHVINFDLPDEPASYIHRIGRTGRADREGIAISFVREKDHVSLEAIEGLMQQQIPELRLPEIEISSELIDEEEPVVPQKYIPLDRPKGNAGDAFHEKSARNSKVNKVIPHKERMMKKYGKPIRRSGKKKK